VRDGMCECGWERRVVGCDSEGAVKEEKLEMKRRSSLVRCQSDPTPRRVPSLGRGLLPGDRVWEASKW
jgi:hypothetical protein